MAALRRLLTATVAGAGIVLAAGTISGFAKPPHPAVLQHHQLQGGARAQGGSAQARHFMPTARTTHFMPTRHKHFMPTVQTTHFMPTAPPVTHSRNVMVQLDRLAAGVPAGRG